MRRYVIAADLDGDDDLDVVSAAYNSGNIIVYLNDGAGTFTEGAEMLLNTPTSIMAADMDNDGDLDLLSNSYKLGSVVWYENDGEGNFSSAVTIGVESGAIQASRAPPNERKGNSTVWLESPAFKASPS